MKPPVVLPSSDPVLDQGGWLAWLAELWPWWVALVVVLLLALVEALVVLVAPFLVSWSRLLDGLG